MMTMEHYGSVMDRLKSIRVPTGFIRNTLTLAGSTLVTQGIFFAASPILTRIYLPDDFGTLGVFSSILSLALPVASWRYEYPITLPQDDEYAANVLGVAVLVLLMMTALAGGSLWFLGDSLVKSLHVSSKQLYSCLLVGGLFGGGLFQALNFWAVRKKAFAQIARTKVTQGSMTAGTQILVGLLHAGPLGLILGDVVGRVAGIRMLAQVLWQEKSKLAGSITGTRLTEMARSYKRFPLYSSGAAILNAAGLYSSPILMASLYGPQAAGYFSLALRLLSLPTLLVGQALGQAYWAEVSTMRHKADDLRRLFYRILRTSIVVGGAVIVPLVWFAPTAIATLFGEQWRESGYYLQLLSLSFLGDFVSTPLSSTLTVLERQSWQLAWDACRLVFVVIAFAGLQYWGCSARTAALGYAVAQLTSYVIHLILAGIAIHIHVHQQSL
ncbi:MAG TPA: oligosaccharide flippase family protein [Desulfomonilaceae bacterium]|nr:oligosaccharide flippase family protein [Desulfomonilaceae bacterium]